MKIAVKIPVLAQMRKVFKMTDNISAYKPTHMHTANMSLRPKNPSF